VGKREKESKEKAERRSEERIRRHKISGEGVERDMPVQMQHWDSKQESKIQGNDELDK